MIKPIASAALAALLLAGSSPLARAQRAATVDDLLRIAAVSDPQLSPDGTTVAYVVTTADFDENVQNSEIWQVSTAGGPAVQLTRHVKADTSPRWSPDGTTLAFLSTRSGKAQIHLLDARGGESRALTSHKEAISSFEWAPDGSALAFTSVVPRPDDLEQRVKDRWVPRVVGEDLRPAALWTADATTGAIAQVTDGKRHVTAFDWSPDSRRLVVSSAVSPDLVQAETADLFVVSRAGGDERRIGGFASADSQPRWSPDGTKILFTSRGDREGTAWNSHVYALDVASGAVAPLVEGFDENPSRVEWGPDSRQVYFVGTRRTQRHLFDGSGRALTSGRQVVSGYSFDDAYQTVAYVREAPGEPADVFVAPASEPGEARRLTSHNPAVAELALGEQEVIRWTNSGGQEVEGILVKPVGYTPGAKVPLIVVIHGGPAGVDTDGFIGRKSAYPVQVYAGLGYASLLVNYRGSTGYGEAWRRGNVGSLGAAEHDDIESGVDALVARGFADPDRLGYSGWSYGGHMTYWAVTHTTRYKAASSGAGATNLISMYGQTDIPHFYTKTYFGKAPWDDFDFYVEHSSFFRVGQVQTPTLIQYGENDARVPVPQGLEFHRALKERGVPSQLVIYPGQAHGILEPRFQLDLLQRNLDWFTRWIPRGADGAAPTSTASQ